ncbi:MAG: putative lipid II flippase FtsW [Oscillospiraceae bacterium]|jgi:cell division protein FtsW|nr:putative lipid II flippase FtsW [Oscillospiraceae bacterium]
MSETTALHAAQDVSDRRSKHIDIVFLALTLLILAVGLVMLLSASYAREYYTTGNPMRIFNRQVLLSAVGIVALLILTTLPETFYDKFAIISVVVSVIGLIVVLFVGTEADTGGVRAILIGPISIQPSEFAKFTVILAFAKLSVRNEKKMKKLRSTLDFKQNWKYRLKVELWYTVFPYCVILAVICGLLVLEPHVSACIIFIFITGAMMFQSGTKIRYLLILLALVALAGIFMYKTGVPGDYVKQRVVVWQDPWNTEDPVVDKWGYQTRQSLIAVGSGGLMGLGLGQSRQKHLYLPEEHNDFIFSIVCEELGFVGALLILSMFVLLIVRGYWLALRAKTKFSSLVIAGITTQLALQVFLNVSVVTNLIPCTGISLPFFSYGGSALLCQMSGMGIILALSKQPN